MELIYEKFIKPNKNDYIVLGALILLIEILGDLFAGHLMLNFLISIPLFVISILLLNLAFKGNRDYHRNKVTIWTLLYIILFGVFVLSFFIAALSKYPTPFTVYFSLICGLFLLLILIEFRTYIVILQLKIKKTSHKRIIRILFLILILILWIYITLLIDGAIGIESLKMKFNSFEGMKSLSDGEWFYLILIFVNFFSFGTLTLMNFFDIFKKEPIGYKNRKWKKTRLARLIAFVKNGGIGSSIEKFYTDFLD